MGKSLSFSDKILDVTSCETLMETLGSRGVRIARELNEIPEESSVSSNRGRRSYCFHNEFMEYFQEHRKYHEIHPEIEDILVGISRLDWYGENRQNIPLSYKMLLDILTNLEYISANSIMNAFNISKRHSQRYCQAIRMSVRYITRVLYRFQKIYPKEEPKCLLLLNSIKFQN